MTKRYKFEKRRISVGGLETSISVERLYWAAIDHIAHLRGQSPKEYLDIIIANQPPDYKSRAGWIRYWVTGQYFLSLKKGQQAAASNPG